MKKILFIQLLMMFIDVSGQIDPVKDALNFFPMHTGDYWQYKVEKKSSGLPEPDTSWTGFKEITGDTIMQNSKKYFVVKEDHITFPYQPFFRPRFIRIDSATAELYEYDITNKKENKIDSLLIKKGDIFSGYECTSDTVKEYFGIKTEAKLISQYYVSSTAYDGRELAKGFGEIMRYYNDISIYSIHYTCHLIYAKIDGKEFGVQTDIRKTDEVPDQMMLYQNYPNPFNPSTTIRFTIPVVDALSPSAAEAHTILKVYDILGREIKTLIDERKEPSSYSITFDAGNISSGIYYYRLTCGKYSQTKKLILLK